MKQKLYFILIQTLIFTNTLPCCGCYLRPATICLITCGWRHRHRRSVASAVIEERLADYKFDVLLSCLERCNGILMVNVVKVCVIHLRQQDVRRYTDASRLSFSSVIAN